MWFKQSFYPLKTHLLGCKSIAFANQKHRFCMPKAMLLQFKTYTFRKSKAVFCLLTPIS
ncbi:hypothetical protein HMPREF9151_01518 [Hoylesella saccharolytica F0055]|uniref:Uncharacterized protein n=1 Tax=Hoylesella saccharolytica F0055 TaxID=1127699 RepID=L1N9M0_9BACT|nr:hypothetical protein HMPREF9151_01518 [Hoylesella saccharolytica F0055]